MKMNIRKEIETLLLWYIPTILITMTLGVIVTAQVKSINEYSFGLTTAAIAISYLTNHLHNIVIAIWLYILAKKLNQKYILWSLFGLLGHLFAVIIFIALKLLEDNNLDQLKESEILEDTKLKSKFFIWSK